MQVLNNLLFHRDSSPFGITFEDWTIKWWLWLLNIPKKLSPTFDPQGKNWYVGQNNPNVFFLCQTVEGLGAMPCRSISLPAGRCIFMPIINWLSISNKDGKTEDGMRAIAKEKIDEVASIDFTINGMSIAGPREDFRVASRMFEAILPEENIFDEPGGRRNFVSDGFWIFLKPLADNSTLNSFGSCSTGATRIGVNYDVKIIR